MASECPNQHTFGQTTYAVPRDPEAYEYFDHARYRGEKRAGSAAYEAIVEQCIREGTIRDDQSSYPERRAIDCHVDGECWRVVIQLEWLAFAVDDEKHKIVTLHPLNDGFEHNPNYTPQNNRPHSLRRTCR